MRVRVPPLPLAQFERVTMKRCHNCLRKITEQNPSSAVDKWGNEVCDTCTLCTHGQRLIDDCVGCEDDVKAMIQLQNEAESGECWTCGRNFIHVKDAMEHIIKCREENKHVQHV